MKMTKNCEKQLRHYIDAWSVSKKTNISYESFVYEIATIQRLIGKETVDQAVEIGSGSGLFLLTAVALGFIERATGVEPSFEKDGTSSDEVDKTKEYISKLDLSERIAFTADTFETFCKTQSSSYFDMILFRQTLHHIFDKEVESNQACIASLASLRSQLSDNGHIVILEASERSHLHKSLYSIYRSMRGIGQIKWPDKRSTTEWVELLKEAGYKSIQIEKMPINLFSSVSVLNPLRRLLSCTFVIVGEK